MREPAREPEGPATQDGLGALFSNVRSLPINFWRSIIRHGAPTSNRTRSQSITNSLFLHIHSARTHRWTLRKSFTLGLGVATGVLFLILLGTGVMLMLFYKPTTAEAYNSIKDIHYVVPGGRLLRNVHRSATNLMIFTVILHMARVFYTAAYKSPREFNWLIGVGLLVLTLALGFTGYCLPWDQLAYWAVVIGTNIAGSTSEVTEALHLDGLQRLAMVPRRILLGSDYIGDAGLLRFYWLHCVALPILMILFIAIHLWRIRKDGGISRPTDIRPEELTGTPEDELPHEGFSDPNKRYTLSAVVPGTSPNVGVDVENTVLSWPHALKYEMVVTSCILALVLLLAFFFDAPLKEPANPNVPENPAKAPWYFLGLQEVVSYSAFAGGMAIPALSVIGLALIPYLDRSTRQPGRWSDAKERNRIYLSAVFTLALCIATIGVQVRFGWLRDWFPDINQIWIVLINPGTIVMYAVIAMSVFETFRARSTRLGAIVFFTGLLVFYGLFTYFGTVHRGPNWDFYWWPSQWPEH